ncbi:hypothetical protein [Acidithiobacillus ferrivorans]|jgi:hypothetical protein|uniref:hypothetical protein n=1 Tax=Acidithiobacillus ferrivorans TaxID=160808 RepID=UPI001680D068|nr:hypothetical protein [Acidithiobacillus ferrivorans]
MNDDKRKATFRQASALLRKKKADAGLIQINLWVTPEQAKIVREYVNKNKPLDDNPNQL